MKIHPITIATCFAGIMLALVCIGWAGTPATPKVPKGWTFNFS